MRALIIHYVSEKRVLAKNKCTVTIPFNENETLHKNQFRTSSVNNTHCHVAGEDGVGEQRDVTVDNGSRRPGGRSFREGLGTRPIAGTLHWRASRGDSIAPPLFRAPYSPEEGHGALDREKKDDHS